MMLSHARLGLAEVQLNRGVWSEVDELLAQEYRDPVTLIGSSLLKWDVAEARGVAWERPWERGDPQFETLTTVEWRKEAALALMVRVDGDLPGAVGVALDGLDRSRAATGLGESFSLLWRLAADMVAESDDVVAHDRLIGLIATDDVVPLALLAHRARFTALWAMRHRDDDVAVEVELRSAIDCYERLGSRLLAARTAADLGTWLLRDGRHMEAEPLL